jgi:hypothetical protein
LKTVGDRNMRYRIIEKNSSFRIKYKWGPFWFYLNWGLWGITYPAEFRTKEEAILYLKKEI